MFDGKQQADWAQTSNLLAMMHNTHVDRKGKIVQPRQYNPYAQRDRRKEKPTQTVSIATFAKALTSKK